MRNESDLAGDIANAKQAEAIVNHPLFIASIKSLREMTVDKFESLGFDNILQMQECNVRLNLIEELEINLSTVILNGDAALKTLEDIQTFNQELENERKRRTNTKP